MEKKAHMGIQFHRIVQQILSGVKPEDVMQSIEDNQLSQWVTRFITFINQEHFSINFPELSVMMAFNGYRILSVFDLVVVKKDNKAMIFDWKTTQKEPKPSFYSKRIQSQVYPMVMVESCQQFLPGQSLKPDDVEMVYWFPEFPERAIHMGYSQAGHLDNKSRIADLIGDIIRREPGDFELTQEKNRCKYCMYRSLCDRGRTAGNESEESEDPSEISLDLLDFDQIEEIPY